MKVYFDHVTMGFYTTEHFKSFPNTAVNIPLELYKELQVGETRGMQIACDDTGYPFLRPLDVDIEFLISAEHIWITAELANAGLALDKVQDSDATAVGTVGQWREYRKALRAWPSHKDFPNKDSRPNPQPTPEQLQEQINAEALAYLADTDWYVIRMQETGQAVPEEILEARSQARSRIVDIPVGV